MVNILSPIQKAARAAEMAARVRGLARAAEIRAIASLSTHARVKGLAQQAEADMKASLAKKKAEIIKGQNSRITTGKGPESVGYRDAPLPGSLAAIPRGGDVPVLDKLPGKQISTRSDFYKRRK